MRGRTLALVAVAVVGCLGQRAEAGKLELGPCTFEGLPKEARCGTYEVFEDRAAGSGRRIPLRVVVVPANAPQKHSDAVAYFSGGPGESAVEDGSWVVSVLRQNGPQTRDLLLVDLRGNGGSGRLDCAELAGIESRQGFLDDFQPAASVRSCRERLSGRTDLTRYTSAIAVDDVDEVRAALGYDKLDLYAASYGTRTALTYMRRHPDRVRTAALFRVVANDARTPLQFARTAQDALDGLIAECSGDAACRAAFPGFREEVDEILRRVKKEPVRVELADAATGRTFELRFNRDGLAQMVRYMLYDTDAASKLPLYAHLAAQGDFRPIAEHALRHGIGGWSSNGFFLAITCAEDVPFIREEEIPAAVAGTFLGDFRIRRQQAACQAWTAVKLGTDVLAPVVSDIPTLIVSGERDPVTPPSDGEKTVRHLRHGVHVVVPDAAHSISGMKGWECEGEMFLRLLEAGSTEGLDTSCVARMRRPAFALGFGGPEVAVPVADLDRLVGTYRDGSGFEGRVEVVDGKRLRVRFSDGTVVVLPTSPTRFRTAYGTFDLVFRMEGDRVVAMGLEQSGQLEGEELKRVSAAGQVTAVRFARLIPMRGEPVSDAVVVVEGTKIKAVGQGDGAVPAGARVLDLRPLVGLPALIDAHTHMSFYWDRSPGTNPWSQLGSFSTPVLVFLAQENARRTLEAGVTTVRDLGAPDYADVALRDLINRGAMPGPRMFVAGAGLHISSYPLRPGYSEPDPGRADGMAGVLYAARQQLAAGADWIKMYGSTGSDEDVTGFQTFTLDEMRAAVSVAHQAGKRIAVHSYGPDGARDAVAAGADSVEHATDMDDATIAAMARTGVFYVPTVDHNRYYVDHREQFGYGEDVVSRLNDYRRRNLETLRKAVKAGVKVAMGSDAVFDGFGENARELEAFVEAGMTPGEALRCATVNGAALLGLESELGVVAPGFDADLIAVEGDPLQNIQAVSRGVAWVMKDGAVVVDRREQR